MITLRNPQPTMSERLVNYGFLYGFKFEMELRYDTDQRFIREDAAPERRIYAKKVSDLRRKYEDFLLLGTFRADEGIEYANVYADTFVAADGRRAVALWNDSDETVKLDLILTSGTVASWATIDGAGEGVPESMAPNSVALLLIKD